MKKALLLLCLLAVCHFSFAQNWMPFRVGETYNYTNSTPDFIYPNVELNIDACPGPYFGAPSYPPISTPIVVTHNNELQIWIDTIISNALDSIFYFNTRVLPCDTCATPAIIINQPLGFAILHDSFVKNTLGQYIFHYNGDSLILAPYLALNDSLISDYSNGLIAKITQVNFTSIGTYTISDSIKTINYYSNNILKYQIVITRNHGINYFKDYQNNLNEINQVGIESKNLGIVQLNAKRIYDFNIGDVFYYQNVNDGAMGGYDHSIYSLTILNRQDISSDTTIYSIARKLRTNTNYAPPYTTYINDTFIWIMTPSNMNAYHYFNYLQRLNARDNELVDYDNGMGEPLRILEKNFLRGINQEYKYLSYNMNEDSINTWSNYCYPSAYVLDTFSNTYYQGGSFACLTQVYGKGIGIIYCNEGFFEGYGCVSLLGYIKNNDTTGTIIPNGILLGTENPLTTTTQNFNLTLYPNPTQENLTLELDKLPLTDFLQIDVIDLHGRVLFSQQKTPQNSYTISVEGFSNGLYLLQLKDERGGILGLKKFVVKK